MGKSLPKSELIELRVGGKFFGEFDPVAMLLHVRRGKIERTIDLRASAAAGRAIAVEASEAAGRIVIHRIVNRIVTDLNVSADSLLDDQAHLC